MDSSEALYKSLKKFSDLERLVDEGEKEGLYLEAKAPTDPVFNKDEKMHLARTVSAFSNTSGGVMIYGVETTHFNHHDIDTIIAIPTVANVAKFSSNVVLQVTQQLEPSVTKFSHRILKRKTSSTNGVLVLYIPKASEPTRCQNNDKLFYVRNGDENIEAPYHTIARLFTLSNAPDLRLEFPSTIAKKDKDGRWDIKLSLMNKSRKAPDKALVMLTINNVTDTEILELSSEFKQVSDLNPGKVIYSTHINEPVFKGISLVIGSIKIKMAKNQRRKRVLKLYAQILAHDMEPRETDIKLLMSSNGTSVTENQHNPNS